MAGFRSAIPDFQLANPLYTGARVSFFTIDANGASTGILATLYTSATGTATAANPQTLDADGKFSAPVYLDAPVVAEAEGPNIGSHTTGPIGVAGRNRGNWITGTFYFSQDLIRDPNNGDWYMVRDHHTAGVSIAADVAANHLELFFQQAALGTGIFVDTAFELKNAIDTTKIAFFELSRLTTATIRTFKLPDLNGTVLVAADLVNLTTSGTSNLTLPTSGTLATLAGAENLSNKTLTSAVIATSLLLNTGTVMNWNAGDVTLTHSADTLTLAGGALVLAAGGLQVGSGNTVTLGGALTTAGAASIPAIAQGNLLYGSATGVLSALAKDTNPSRYLSNTGGSNNPAWAQVDLTNGVSGDLPFANIAQIATARLVGNISGGLGDLTALTGAQAGGLILLGDLSDVGTATATKGNIIAGDGSAFQAIAVGTNNFVLTADSAQATGVKWAAAPGAGGGLSNAYNQIYDGTTTAAASGADTVKFRAGSGLTVAVGSNDVTHGDNVLYSIDTAVTATLNTANSFSQAQTFLNASGIKILDTDASNTLGIVGGSNLTSNRTLTLTTGDANRNVTLTGDFAMSGAFNLTLTTTAGTNVTLPTTGTLATLAGSETFTNKRITKRIGTTASSATPTPDADNHDQFTITALAAGATFAAPTGTPTDGQAMVLRIKDNGTARSLAYNAIFRAIGITLPTSTVISKTTYIGIVYNAADTKWDALATGTEA